LYFESITCPKKNMPRLETAPSVETLKLEASLVAGRMTETERELSKTMFRTLVDGKLQRRLGDSPRNWTIEEDLGIVPMITIARDLDHEFAGTANVEDPRNPYKNLLLYFVNFRGAPPEVYELMALAIKEKGIGFDFECIVGVPKTGSEIGMPLANQLNKPYFEMLEKVGEGKDKIFKVKSFKGEGEKPFGRVLLVDDVRTTNLTKNKAEHAMKSSGFDVAGHVVVLDREEDDSGNVVSVITATQLFAVGFLEGDVSAKDYFRITEEIKAGKRRRRAGLELEAQYQKDVTSDVMQVTVPT
jgi:orotate phosphoribosyltransferase